MQKLVICCTFIFILSSGHAQPERPVSFSLFLVGHSCDMNLSEPDHDQFIQTILNYNNNKKGIIFLGNNLSASQTDDPDDQNTVPWLRSLLRFDGPVCFIPGRVDWADGSSEGKDMIKQEYETIHDLLKQKEVYMPDAACPGPVEININDSLSIILIDTQWWLHPFDTRMTKCDLEEKDDFLVLLQDALRRNRNKEIVVAGYFLKRYTENILVPVPIYLIPNTRSSEMN